MKYVKMARVNDFDTLGKDSRISYETIILEAQEEYCSLLHSNQWTPVLNSNKLDEPSLPTAFKTEITKAV